MKTKVPVLFLIVVLAFILDLVKGCATVSASYAEADRATYNVLAPLARERWIPADTTLTAEERGSLVILLDSWDFRIRAAEDPE